MTQITFITNNFTYKEMVFSETAIRHGLDNTPNEEQIANYRALCSEVMEKVRSIYGKPVTVTSGFRSQAVNKKIKSKPTSAHTRGEAIDFFIHGVCLGHIMNEVISREDIHYDQIILEFNEWIHISHVRNGINRRQALRTQVVSTPSVKGSKSKTIYVPYHP